MNKLEKSLEKLDPEERKKLKALLQDKNASDNKVEWLYKSAKPESEEYLLGRRIDKHVEEEHEKPASSAVGAIFDQEVLAHNAKKEMKVKMREDPLFAIRKREEDARRKLLDNPVKMKRLQEAINAKTKDKKKKKHKKKHGSGSDDDDELLNKYMSILKQKEGKKSKLNVRALKKMANDSSSDSEEDGRPKSNKNTVEGRSKSSRGNDRFYDSNRDRKWDDHESTKFGDRSHSSSKSQYHKRHYDQEKSTDNERNKKHKDRYRSHQNTNLGSPARSYKHRSRSRSPVARKRHDSSSSSNDAEQAIGKTLPRKRHHSSSSEDSRNNGKSKHNQQNDSDSDGQRKLSKGYGLLLPGKSKYSRKFSPQRSSKLRKSRSRSPVRKKSPPRKREKTPPKKKLTSEEMERKRQEMMQDAKWRDDQRSKNVQRYTEEEKKEQERYEKQGDSSDFLNPLILNHAAGSSLEDRIKRNRYNIQRTNVALEKNFAKK